MIEQLMSGPLPGDHQGCAAGVIRLHVRGLRCHQSSIADGTSCRVREWRRAHQYPPDERFLHFQLRQDNLMVLSSEQGLQVRFDHVCVLKPDDLVAKYALAIIEHGGRQPLDAAELLLQFLRSDGERVMDTDPLCE